MLEKIDGQICWRSDLEVHVSQGAGKGVDPPTKVPMPETPVFGSGPTWGTTFTKVILLRMADALLYF